MAQSGKVVLLFVNVGTEAAPVWSAVAQQQGMEINRSRNTETVRHKDSQDDVVILGTKSKSISLNGALVRNDEATRKLRSAYESGANIKVRVRESGTDVSEFLMRISELNESHPIDGASAYNMTLVPADEEVEL